MLQVHHLHKTYGAATVLEDISFVLNDGERVGLIGPNGTGKSTLLRCLVGDEQPDQGQIVLSPSGARVGYLPQAFAEHDQRTLSEIVATVETRLRPAAVLSGLGLGDVDPDKPVHELSGGQKTRLGLATLLLGEPDLLLLDEPTNHLDVDALEWLEGFLSHYRGAVLIVSHDRVFLDATVDRILYLDPETRTLRGYTGGYLEFAEARAHERDLQEQTWRRQQEYVGRVRSDIGRMKSEARSIENSTTARQPGLRKLARKKAAVAKSRERKLERYLTSDERVERPSQRWPINLRFGEPPPGSQLMLHCEDVGFGYPAEPSQPRPYESAAHREDRVTGRTSGRLARANAALPAPRGHCSSSTSVSTCATGNAWRWWVRTAAARRRCCGCWLVSFNPSSAASSSGRARGSESCRRNRRRSIRRRPCYRRSCASGP